MAMRYDCIGVEPETYDFGQGYDVDDEDTGWSIVLPDPEGVSERHALAFIDDQGDALPDEWRIGDAGAEWRCSCDPEAWHSSEVDECEACRDSLDDLSELLREAFTEACRDNREAFEPQMNYRYSIPERMDAEWAAARILESGLPLVVVRCDGLPYLALAGGGVDLSWEICEAYMALDLYPPAHFAGSLPRMAGRGKGPSDGRDGRIMEACLASLEAVESRARSAAESLRERMIEAFGTAYPIMPEDIGSDR